MSKYLLSTTEIYRVESEAEAKQVGHLSGGIAPS